MKKVIHTLLALTFVSGALLLSNFSFADSSEVVTTSITVPIACTMQGSGTTHTATLAPSTYSGATGSEYENGIGKTTLTAICNDDNGFAIYAVGYTGNSYDSENHTKLVGQNTQGTISTKVYTSGDTASNWSMKLIKVTNTSESYNPQNLTILDSFDSWHAVPDAYTKVAQYKANTGSSTTDTTLGVKLETTYAAYIASNQAADTYVGQVKYTMVHPYDAASPIIPVTIEDAYSKANKQKYNGYYKIQDMTQAICGTVNQYGGDGMTEVVDIRDNNIYHVAKLADDNCWMLDNLALDPTDPTTAANISASNTNASTEAITNYLNGGSSINGWSSVAVVNKTSGWIGDNAYIRPYINNQSKNTLVTSYGLAATNGLAKVGLYYNYCAATVGTYCYAGDSGIDVPNTIVDATQDICPVNWRMPTGGFYNDSEYYGLALYYNTYETATNNNSLQYNLSTPLSGYFYDNLAFYNGEYGDWWSSTYSGVNRIYELRVTPSVANTYGYNADRIYGLPVRCLVGN